MRLAETIAGVLGRVEVVLAGVEGHLHEGQAALARGDGMRARQSAKAILARVPSSPIGLALLADACEVGHLDAELALTLEELAARVASRAEIWVRLGRARARVGSPSEEVRDAFLRALAVAEPGTESRRDALLWLADFDLASGDGGRAELWLERLVDRNGSDVALRRAEARLLTNDVDGANAVLKGFEPDVSNPRDALVRGRAFALMHDPKAFPFLVRAMVLEAPLASEALASALAWIPSDDAVRTKIRAVVEARDESELARWKAAFARAEGRRDEAKAALLAAVRSGESSAARPLLDGALEDHDFGALGVALGALAGHDDAIIDDAKRLPSPAKLRDAGEVSSILDGLADVSSAPVLPWAKASKNAALATWIPKRGSPSDWTRILTRLDRHARALHALDSTSKIADLAVERSRPVRLAIVGEFNAGKSTFINAVMGADVAPTGVLPTTATLHHLRYAPDPFARIQFYEGDVKERIVPSSELRSALRAADPGNVRRVEILVPIPSLTRVEILDTPGFNAPDARHAEAARGAFEEADVAIWLFDAGQPIKQSERTILEEARAQKLPIQMLVNKADRLAPDDLEKVMANVEASLGEIGMSSWSRPLALSARLALQGKLGDGDALARSGWSAVQTLLDEQMLGRSDELKERGLRRRATRVVRDLLERAREVAVEEAEAVDRRRNLRQAIALRAAKLERTLDEVSQIVASALRQAGDQWRGDLEVVATGRSATQTDADPVLLRYRVDRAVTRLSPPLARTLATIAASDPTAGNFAGASEADLTPLVRAVVRTFSFSGGTPDDLPTLAQSASSSLVEHLLDLVDVREEARHAEGRVAELEAFVEALG